jgi:hypothetical protein
MNIRIYSLVFKCIYALVLIDWLIRIYVNHSKIYHLFSIGEMHFGFAAVHDYKSAAFIYPINVFDVDVSVNVGILIMAVFMLIFNYAISNKNIRYTLMCSLFAYMAGWLGNILELFLFGSVTNYIGYSDGGEYYNVSNICDHIISSFNFVLLFLISLNLLSYIYTKTLKNRKVSVAEDFSRESR